MDCFELLPYIYYMTVTVEVMNQGTLNLLRDYGRFGPYPCKLSRTAADSGKDGAKKRTAVPLAEGCLLIIS